MLSTSDELLVLWMTSRLAVVGRNKMPIPSVLLQYGYQRCNIRVESDVYECLLATCNVAHWLCHWNMFFEVIAYTAAVYAMSDIAYMAAILYTNVAI